MENESSFDEVFWYMTEGEGDEDSTSDLFEEVLDLMFLKQDRLGSKREGSVEGVRD